VKAFTGELSQAETNYVPLSAVQGKACASCRWFMAYGDCYIVEDEPEPILATGYCDRHEATPVPEPVPDVIETLAEALGEVLDEQAETIATSIYASPMWAERARKALKDVFAKLLPKPKDDAFSVFKGTDGKYHWHAIHTNNFEDLEEEILTEKGHDGYIARLDMNLVPMPVLESWHTPGTEHGKATLLWRSGHFVHAVGDFDETPIAEKAIEYYRKNKGKIKLSHGFTAPEWAFDGKHYDEYNTFEISTLPPFAAANPFTSFEEIKEMAMTDDKRQHLEAMFGKDFVTGIEAKDIEHGKALEDARVAYKDYAKVDLVKPELKTDTEKALGTLYSELLDSQTEMLGAVKGLVGALKSKDTEIATIKTENDGKIADLVKGMNELRAQVNMPPQRASQSDATVNKDETLKDKTPKGDPLSNFFGVPMKAEN
jgi:hypothetical protein